jgi:hypothetical protein
MAQYPERWRGYEPVQPRGRDGRAVLRRLWAPLAAIGAILAKFGVVLLKVKFLFSIFVSAFYVWFGGWWFGIGLVVLLFVHEMGHAIWLLGFLALVALVIYRPNPLLIIIVLFAASELRRRWKLRHHPQMQTYYRVKPAQTCDRRAALLRPRSRARARHARNTRAAAILGPRCSGVGNPVRSARVGVRSCRALAEPRHARCLRDGSECAERPSRRLKRASGASPRTKR